MSGFSETSASIQDGTQQAFDANQYQTLDQQVHHPPQPQPTPQTSGNDGGQNHNVKGKQRRSSPIPRIRRACTACHAGKTRCSESLPCQNCLKRGAGDKCTYPDPDNINDNGNNQVTAPIPPAAFMGQISAQASPLYYDYSASTSTFRPTKRTRPLTEDEAAAITRNFQRGDFYVGSSGPVRIDPRLPVRLTLGEGNQVHFIISEALL